MNRLTLTTGLVLAVVVLAAVGANAQQATERYIPIGESPGVSDSELVIGTISSIDYADHTMGVSTTDGEKSVTPGDSTRYYIDRSKQKRSNDSATLRDCEVGMKIEARLKPDGSVDWIKIDAQ